MARFRNQNWLKRKVVSNLQDNTSSLSSLTIDASTLLIINDAYFKK